MNSAAGQLDASKLNEVDKREVAQVLLNEQQKSQIHTSTARHIPPSPFSYPSELHSSNQPTFISPVVHHLSNICWKKCITSKISGGNLDKSEQACAMNCVERYMDTNISMVQHLQTMRGSQ